MLSFKRPWRISGIAGLLFVVLSFVASGMNVQPPAYDEDPAAFVAWFAENGQRFRVGHFIAGLAFLLFYFPFFAGLCERLRAAEGAPAIWSRVAWAGAIMSPAAGTIAGSLIVGAALLGGSVSHDVARFGAAGHLVGFDFGGPTAVMVCAQAPDLIATLTLAGTNVLTDTGIPLPLQLVRPPVVGDVFARLLFGRTGLTMMWFATVARRDRFSLADYRAMLRFPQGITSTRRLFQASLRDLPGLYGPVHAALSGIQVPCTVVWGDRDPFFPTTVGERTAAHIPGARFVQLKGCGHFLPAEDPGGFARVVQELVSGSTLTNGHVPRSQGGSTEPVVANVG